MVKLKANLVSVDDSHPDYIVVAFAYQRSDRLIDAIHFQRAYDFDEQDIRLGMNDVYIERGIQRGGGYGGIDSACLRRDRMQISVSGKTAKSMGSVSFEVTFDIDETEYSRLRDGLETVFAGTTVLTVV
jgi:hypothetical protein